MKKITGVEFLDGKIIFTCKSISRDEASDLLKTHRDIINILEKRKLITLTDEGRELCANIDDLMKKEVRP